MVDNAGIPSYTETTINAVIPEKRLTLGTTAEQIIPKIAFVRPTFTEAAYQEHGFYRFYAKYGWGTNITTDLDMLTLKTPNSDREEYNEPDLMHLTNLTAIIPLNGTNHDDISWSGFPDHQKFWITIY